MGEERTLPSLRRLAAFTTDVAGGNPAGVWVGERLPEPDEMQQIAAAIGYSETAFAEPLAGTRYKVRYYSPQAEVSFCGHATIATGVVLGESRGPGTYVLETAIGDVPVRVEKRDHGWVSSLTSVEPNHRPVPAELLTEVLALLGWKWEELDPDIPPAIAYAGAWHLVLAVRDAATLGRLAYDFEAMRTLMLEHDLTTLQLVWREREGVFHARDPFPVGGVVEDPATGAAAAALGGYLRDARIIPAPFNLVILQGEAMGRPSRIEVSAPAAGGITVTGAAVSLDSGENGAPRDASPPASIG